MSIMEMQNKDRMIISLVETSSTNTELKQLQKKEQLPEGFVVTADFQTQGRGQAGNSWFSDKGRNLLFSFLLYPKFVIANKQFIISRIISLALKEVLDQYMDNISIKWPNDIYWKDKKIAGMLIENNLMGQQIESSIVGIGLNVNQDEFPIELPNPVSMKQVTGVEYNRDEILMQFFDAFYRLYHSLQQSKEHNIEQKYLRQLYRGKGYYWYEDVNGLFEAKIKDILPSGHLILETSGEKQERQYAFKEVSFVL